MQNDHQGLLIRGLVTDLFLHNKLKTTIKRAKLVKTKAEKLITYSKTHDTVLTIRKLNSFLLNQKASKIIIEELLPKYKDRSSGHVTMTNAGYRAGDAAPVCYLELI
ncbi:50S ribosomal protein L17 [Candidatus Peregrinibacteria bacterium RIFOXYB2_FULL_32_7]|nr:MAG: 50S ribosomal protein L17 [Candidatus Peregrinibacteria bacterium RIFOXYB2_FULL_32_7]